MAIVKFGPTIVGARGTIAGTIFSANKAGPFARGWSKGADPQSTLQTAQRGRIGAIAAAWRDLTQPQRDDWIDYADNPPQELTNSLGETYFASGFNWFVRVNDHLEAAAEARRDDAPTLTRPLAPILAITKLHITGSASSTHVRLTVGSPGLAENNIIAAKVVSSQGILPIPPKMPRVLIDVPDGSRFIIFEPELESIYGTIALGQRLLLSSKIQDSHGQRGPADTDIADAEV